MRKYLIFGGIIVLAGIFINNTLGGFEPIEPALISNTSRTIYGLNYEGSHSSDSLDRQIEVFRKILNETNHPGTLTIINYINHSLEKRGVVKQFVGIEWENSIYYPKQKLDSIIINEYNGFQFRIPIKPLVMPSPEKLNELAHEAAKLMDGELLGFSIEQYKDKNLIINFPLK